MVDLICDRLFKGGARLKGFAKKAASVASKYLQNCTADSKYTQKREFTAIAMLTHAKCILLYKKHLNQASQQSRVKPSSVNAVSSAFCDVLVVSLIS
jgi:hypothetical protein